MDASASASLDVARAASMSSRISGGSTPRRAASMSSRASGSSRPSMVSLPMTLEPELLRGVPAQVAFGGWGRHWRMSQAHLADHLLSRQVGAIDVFLSHDWGSSPRLKFLTLLLVFNSRAAFASSFLMSLFIGLLRVLGIIPDELWTVSFSYLTYFLVLCFWQRIRSVFGDVMVFLDKLCINQEDQQLKEEGILGLGAFVLNSRRLLVLWSPLYFTRLWCTYEIGCFLLKEHCEIEIMPIKLTCILYLTAIVWHLMMVSYHIFFSIFGGEVFEEVTSSSVGISLFLGVASAMPLMATLILPVMHYLGMSMMREVAELPRQLREFKVEDAQCFCCTHNHKHPETGQEMICDRELVYSTLSEMYSSCSGASDPLLHFNRRVQRSLGAKFARRLGSGFPLRYVVYLLLASNVPFLAELMPTLVKGPPVHLADLDRVVWFIRRILSWVQPCLAIFFSAEFSELCWRKLNYVASVRLAIALSPVVALAVTVWWASLELALVLTKDDSLLPLVPFVLVLLANLWLNKQTWDTPTKGPQTQEELPTSRSTAEEDTWRARPEWDTWEVEEDGDTTVNWRF